MRNMLFVILKGDPFSSKIEQPSMKSNTFHNFLRI